MALLLLSPSMPRLPKALAKERAANPLQPTSTGKHLALQPASWQSLTSPAYLESFLSKASSKRSSHGTVNSSSTACLVDSDTRTMSGRRVVTAIWLGNFSWLSRSTNNCQSLADIRMPADDVLLAGVGLSPALTKVMVFLEGRNCLAHASPPLIASAMVLRTWSCLHLYRPSPSALVQQLRMCSRVPRLEHSGHAGVSAMPHVCRFDRLGSTS